MVDEVVDQLRLLTVLQVARLLGSSTKFVRDAVHRGDLKYIPVSRGWSFRPQDVAAYLDKIATTGVATQMPIAPPRRRAARRS